MQLNIDLPIGLPASAYRFGSRASGETHGVVLTKPHVVDLILDLASYTADRDLSKLRLLEPACGQGAFLLPAVERLLASTKGCRRSVDAIRNAVRAYDIEPSHVAASRRAVAELLGRRGFSQSESADLVEAWIREGDFLLANQPSTFHVVVGNPPYIRIEQLAPILQREYRRRFASIFDRADLYIAFIEHSLRLLADDGVLSFICADRWTLNRYGAPLRRLIAERFHVRCYIDLHQTSPFESEVIAYPAIFAIGRQKPARTWVATMSSATADCCRAIATAVTTVSPSSPVLIEYRDWFRGDEPWILTTPEQLTTLRLLEAKHAPIESGDTKVRIGVATGNDKIYIVGADADIESDRLVPLVMRSDIGAGQIRHANRFVINTFRDQGGTIDLRDYPRLDRYFQSHSETLRTRHVAQKNVRSWFRTIDRVYPELVQLPKLLIPDIAGSNEVVLDTGHFHPHHNLYYVTSGSWDMRVLGALLSSKIALFMVWSYAVKMRGGYLRFQAQYLRRIRLPDVSSIPLGLARQLATAFEDRDFPRLDSLALEAYALDSLPPFTFVDTRT